MSNDIWQMIPAPAGFSCPVTPPGTSRSFLPSPLRGLAQPILDLSSAPSIESVRALCCRLAPRRKRQSRDSDSAIARLETTLATDGENCSTQLLECLGVSVVANLPAQKGKRTRINLQS